jgi:hypothetical protein
MIAVMGRSPEMVEEAFTNFERTVQEMSLMNKKKKTEYMEVKTRPTNLQFLNVNNFQQVIEFKYLGILITISNNNIIMMANVIVALKINYGHTM